MFDLGITRAPELDRPGLDWLNSDRPWSLSRLAGRFVLLDFWTSGCINCLHILPLLAEIEQRFADDLMVIGVHSPKFTAEQDRAKAAQAIARLNISHPVIQDPEMILWDQYGIRAWPSLVFLSPTGRVIGQLSGEPDRRALLDGIAELIAEGRSQGRLTAGAPSVFQPVSQAAPAGQFAFPAKLVALPLPFGRACYALADSGHHQIALLDDQGAVVGRIGSGTAGGADGSFTTAYFNNPQGLAADGLALWVADTGNHLLRRVDLARGRVETVAGVGCRGPVLTDPLPGPLAALASPWDVATNGRSVFIANAGTHQLLRYDLADGMVHRLAGTGVEALRDGPGAEAMLAQPSGLALSPDRQTLAFTDAEASAVRLLDLDSGVVSTVVGSGLFDFGLIDGPLAAARLQHPLGLDWRDHQRLLVADSYNDTLRQIDLAVGRIDDLKPGFDCHDPLCRPLDQPAAILCRTDGQWLLVDSNQHRILAFNPLEQHYHCWSC